MDLLYFHQYKIDNKVNNDRANVYPSLYEASQLVQLSFTQ